MISLSSGLERKLLYRSLLTADPFVAGARLLFSDNGEHLRMVPYTGDARQKWTVRGNRIINDVFCNDCIGLKKGIIRLKDDADVIACPYDGKPYQHWRVEYL